MSEATWRARLGLFGFVLLLFVAVSHLNGATRDTYALAAVEAGAVVASLFTFEAERGE